MNKWPVTITRRAAVRGGVATAFCISQAVQAGLVGVAGRAYRAGGGSPPPDETPNQFTFTDQSGVALSSTITSASITIAGLGSGVSITLNASGGTIDKNGSGSFASSQSVQNGDTVRARVTSSGSNSTAVSCIVTASPSGVNDTFSATTLAGAPANVPAWFAAQADNTWLSIAGVSGRRIVDVLPSPQPTNEFNPSAVGIVTAWTGGAVDQSRREYLLVAGGGHGDYCGNEAYALSLGDATPAWRRITDPSPNNQMLSVSTPGATYSDGRPRAMHATNEVFGDGRVWYPMMNSVVSGSGGHIDQVLSFNRDSLGDALTPLAWTGANLGPWAFHGSSNANDSNFGFGFGVFDSVNHRIYGVANAASFGIYWWRFDTQGANLGVSTAYSRGDFHIYPAWCVCCPDLDILVVGGDSSGSSTINVLTLSTNTWARPTNISGTGYFGTHGGSTGGCGSVYLAADKSIIVTDTSLIGGQLYKLKIPLSGGAYDPSGQWVWTNSTPGGDTPPVNSDSRGDFSKFALIEDMGNGQSAIVICGGISNPTYVYKVPVVAPVFGGQAVL